MPCYNPIYAIRSSRFSKKGLHEIKIIGPLKISRKDPKVEPLQDFELLLPCGHCIGCRMDYSRKWADRMMLELDHSKKAVFVTLTYNNRHVPFTEVDYNGELSEFGALTLDKRDVQLFFKRLRKAFPENKIRYYVAGEYGSNTDRPHYHAIIFGLGLEDFDEPKILKLNKLKQPIYQCAEIDRAWSIYHQDLDWYDPIGFASVADVSWETCAYVARYVQKKVYGAKSALQDIYECEPEFSLMSRRPGIGNYFPLDHPDIFDYTVVPQSFCSKEMPIPSHFIDFLANEELSCYNIPRYLYIKECRKEYQNDKRIIKLHNSDLGLCELFEREENEKLQKCATLERDKI